MKNSEINYEKLYTNIIELKNDVTKTVQVYSDFFQEYISKNKKFSAKEIFSIIQAIEDNILKIKKSIK